MPDERPGLTWQVIAQQQTTEVTAAGRFRDVVEITFETALGDVGKVSIPVDVYSSEVAASVIGPMAAEMIRVHQLSG